MVLKKSITLSDSFDVDSKDFHKRFCKSQQKAQDFAKKFNSRVASLDISVSLPKIEFLDCWVYMLETPDEGRKGFLVEPQLNVEEYDKFSDNQGGVFVNSTIQLGDAPTTLATTLATIEEEEEEESDDDIDEDKSFVSEEEINSEAEKCDILQSFSCFTYYSSKRNYLVCDLQGTKVTNDDGSMFYRLTDPVIHTSEKAQQNLERKFGVQSVGPGTGRERFGRVDRGQEGIDDFFRNHKCSKLCKMLRSRRIRQDRSYEPCIVLKNTS